MKVLLRLSFVWALSSNVVLLANEVADWTGIMVAATSGVDPVTRLRDAAIVQAAIFDAVNGIEQQYEPIHVPGAAPHGASKRAAAVQAAYVTLVSLFPEQSATFDAERSKSLAGIADEGEGETRRHSIVLGIEWGETVADLILTWRSMDGFSIILPAYTGGTGIGEWRPTPPAMIPGFVPQLATTTPFAIQSPSQFRPAGPTPLTSERYAADFNEVKDFGSIDSQKRNADQTAAAEFWEVSAPPTSAWDTVALNLATRRHLDLSQTSLLLAEVNVAMADAIIACWDAKYQYSFWRPITAIEMADLDENAKTEPDSTWTPLLITPPFPEYPSGHACASGAAVHVLTAWFGDRTRFDVISFGTNPRVVRSFSSFSAAIEEVKNARVFGGIHFRRSCDIGQLIGIRVADYISRHAFRSMNGNAGLDEE